MPLFDGKIFERSACGKEDKEDCIILIRFLKSFRKESHKCGLLSLDHYLEHLKDSFLKYMLFLITDGTDSEAVEAMGKTSIYASTLQGGDLLKAMITVEAALQIQEGANWFVLERQLLPYLGIDFLMKTCSLFSLEEDEALTRRMQIESEKHQGKITPFGTEYNSDLLGLIDIVNEIL